MTFTADEKRLSKSRPFHWEDALLLILNKQLLMFPVKPVLNDFTSLSDRSIDLWIPQEAFERRGGGVVEGRKLLEVHAASD